MSEEIKNNEVEEKVNTEETPVNELKAGCMALSTIGVWGFYGAALGVRRSFRTIEKCDSVPICLSDISEEELGENDLELMKKLVLRGPDEAKFARDIHVQANVKAPLFWWKQFDTYKIGTVRLSDSTMHNIMKKPFGPEDFAATSLIEKPLKLSFAGAATSRTIFMFVLQLLNMLRMRWFELKNTVIDDEFLEVYGQEKFDAAVKARKEGMEACWRQMIEILPDSYLMESTIDLNYQVLRAIYFRREGHKLDEWQIFRSWEETLPYSELITIKKEDKMEEKEDESNNNL